MVRDTELAVPGFCESTGADDDGEDDNGDDDNGDDDNGDDDNDDDAAAALEVG